MTFSPWTMIQQLSRVLCCNTSFPDITFGPDDILTGGNSKTMNNGQCDYLSCAHRPVRYPDGGPSCHPSHASAMCHDTPIIFAPAFNHLVNLFREAVISYLEEHSRYTMI